MDRQLVLKKLPSAKMLPLRVLHPLGQHDIVTQIIRYFKWCSATLSRVLTPGAPLLGPYVCPNCSSNEAQFICRPSFTSAWPASTKPSNSIRNSSRCAWCSEAFGFINFPGFCWRD
jgi:hypothetical protein